MFGGRSSLASVFKATRDSAADVDCPGMLKDPDMRKDDFPESTSLVAIAQLQLLTNHSVFLERL
jgi:hypothetical protein